MRPAQGERLNLLEILPHRYPFLLIDEVVEVDPGVRVVCIKNVTMNDWFFQGHYPDHPVMPGMLILEAMAQTGGILILSSSPPGDGFVAYFTGAERVKFRGRCIQGTSSGSRRRCSSREDRCTGSALRPSSTIC